MMVKTKRQLLRFVDAGCLAVSAIYLLTKIGSVAWLDVLTDLTLIVIGYYVVKNDIQTLTIPNRLVFYLLCAWVLAFIVRLFYLPNTVTASLSESALGCLICAIVFISVYLISRKGLGGGDVKFMMVVGLYLGLEKALTAVLLGSLISALAGTILIVTKRMERRGVMPLAPALYIGIIITLLFL